MTRCSRRCGRIWLRNWASPPDSIADTTHFRDDLDADSLDLYELVMELEDTYGVKMSEQEAEGIVTVGQAVDFVVTRV